MLSTVWIVLIIIISICSGAGFIIFYYNLYKNWNIFGNRSNDELNDDVSNYINWDGMSGISTSTLI